MSEMSKARREALTLFDKWEGQFNRRWRHALEKLKLEPAEAEFLRLIAVAPNDAGYLPWSNWLVRRLAATSLIELTLRNFAKHRSRRRWLGTFCWDAGITLEGRPNVDLVAMKVAVWKALDAYGLTGIGVVEVDVLKQRGGGQRRRLLFHIHVIVEERTGAKFRPKKAAKKLCPSRRFRNGLGAPSVQFKRIGATADDLARVAAYITKFPPAAKNMVPSRKRPGRSVFRDCKMAPSWALRLLEALSHIRATDAVFGIGKRGKRQRHGWTKRFKLLLGKQRGRPNRMARDHDIAAEWARIRSRNGSKSLKPCRIITRTRDRE